MAKFQKGQSGNPSGRKRGTSQADKLRKAIESDLPDIVEAMVNSAKGGDVSAAKLLIDRCLPCIKPIQQSVLMDDLACKQSLSDRGEAVVVAIGNGNLSPEQGQAILSALGIFGKIREMDEIENRLAALEASQIDD